VVVDLHLKSPNSAIRRSNRDCLVGEVGGSRISKLRRVLKAAEKGVEVVVLYR
jgi:hypothetical protein